MSRKFAGFALLMLGLLGGVPDYGHADFMVTNMTGEVGVSAGEFSDGVVGGAVTDVFLSVTDGVPGTSDFQLAEALFLLAVDDDTTLGDYTLTYDSQTSVTTGGIGDAGALANGIIVFALSEDFNVTSLTGETIFDDSLGEPVVLPENTSVRLTAGIYSLSFGSSAFISDGDSILEINNSESGLVSFTAVPEPGLSFIGALGLVGLSRHRRRRR